MTVPTRLLHFRVSHYNEKVRWALDFKGWPHVRRALVPAFHTVPARLASGQSKLPVLIHDGVVMCGSSRILAEIERLRPDPPLLPPDQAGRARARALEAHFDDVVAPELRRLFWSTYLPDGAACARMATDGFSTMTRVLWRASYWVLRPALRANMGVDAPRVQRARDHLLGHCDRLASEIGPDGYLVGDHFTVADLAVAAVMTSILRPPQFPYPLPEPWPQALVDLRAGVVDHAAYRWVLDIYARRRSASAEITPAALLDARATTSR